MIDHHDFHYARAKAETEAAERATTAEAVRAHCELADLHFEKMREAAQGRAAVQRLPA